MNPALTDRQRRLLLDHSWANHAHAVDDIDERGDDPVAVGGRWYLFDRLPPCTFGQDVAWRRMVARSFADLATDLEAGELPHPRTTAEQLALRLIIEDAARAHATGEIGDEVALLDRDPRDGDWPSVVGGLLNEPALAAFYDPRSVDAWLKLMPLESWFTPDDPAHARGVERI